MFLHILNMYEEKSSGLFKSFTALSFTLIFCEKLYWSLTKSMLTHSYKVLLGRSVHDLKYYLTNEVDMSMSYIIL